MANAILYYRTYATRTSVTADPQNLPTAQKLEFTFPDDIMEGINESYTNNIKQLPIPNQDGTRKINIQENGLSANQISISGVFKKSSAVGITRLKSMRKIKQVDTHHVFGIFGIEIDTAPQFNLDPSTSQGLHIISTTLGYAGQRNTRYDFTVKLGFGGTIV